LFSWHSSVQLDAGIHLSGVLCTTKFIPDKVIESGIWQHST